MAELKVWITADSSKFIAGTDKATKSLESYRKKMMDTSKNAQERATNEDLYIKKLQLEAEAMHNSATSANEYVAWAKKLKQEQARVNATMGSSTKAYKAITEELLRTKNGMKELEAEQKKLNATTAQSGSKFGELLLNIIKFRIVMVATTQLWNAFKTTLSESVNVASEAEQIFNKLETVFEGLGSSAKSAATNISNLIGVSKSTAASALSTVGDLLQAQGMGTSQSLSTASDWVSKFQDIIAFKDLNVSLEEFAQNFMSGAAGNLRNFRTFGSIVKESAVNARLAAQGMDKLTGSELELAKMTARAEIALEQQANAMGATQREWESALSVNRRLTEAWKEYKENIGESINKVLTPAKGWLANILDYTNDVTKALKEIDGGEFTVKVQQADSEDFFHYVGGVMNEAVKNIVSPEQSVATNSVLGMAGLGGISLAQSNYEKAKPYLNPSLDAEIVSNIMMATGATFDQILEVAKQYGYDVDDTIRDAAEKIVKDNEDAIRERERLISSWGTASEGYYNILSSIAGIKGVNINGRDDFAMQLGMNTPTSQNQVDIWSKTLELNMESALREALQSMTDADWKMFTDPIELALGNVDELKGLDGKLDAVKQLYETLYNYYTSTSEGGIISEENQKVLDGVLGIYMDILAAQKLITDEQQAQLDAEKARQEMLKKYNSALSTLTGGTNDYRKQIYQFDMTDREKAFDDLERQYKSLIDIEGLDASQKATLEIAYQQEVEALTKLNALQDERTKRLEEEARIAEEIKRSEERTSSFISGGASNRLAIEQFGMSDMEKALDDLARAYRELTFEEQNDLADVYIQQADDIRELYRLQDEYNKKLEEEAELKKRQAEYEKSVKGWVDQYSSYTLQASQLGMTDAQKTRAGLVSALDAADPNSTLYTSIKLTIEAFDKLQKETERYNNELKREELLRKASSDRQALLYANSQSAADYRLQATQLGMSSSQITRMGLTNQAAAAIDADDMELYRSIMDTVKAFDELTQKTKEYEDELARQEAWQNLGQSALNSVGPVGSAINTMVNGDGDIWTRLLEVVLDIFQQSEHWSEVVDALNQIIQPILPLVEMIAYTLQSLAPVWEAISFVLKIVSTVIAQILGGINMVIDVIQWVWDNLKIAFKNLSTDIYNWFHWNNKKEREDYKNILDYWEETADATNDVLYKIWHGVTDDSSINYLEELLKRDIITVDQYNAGLRVAQKDMVFDPVTPAQYVASGSSGGSTVQYGNVTLTINGGNIEETQRVVINVMREAGYDIGNVPLYT